MKRFALLSTSILLAASPAAAQSRSSWQMHQGEGLVAYGFMSPGYGDPSEYEFATVPPVDDPGWGSAPNPDSIGYSGTSTLCGVLECREGGEFTYFQTLVDIPANVVVSTFTITFSGIDDGVRVSIFNSAYPDGMVVPGSFVFLGGTGTSDLAALVRSGEVNRVVVTHVDDCCFSTSLGSAAVILNGQEVITDPCPNDPDDDADGDGLCADEDPCPNDPENDADGDGVCGDLDLCPGTDAPEASVPTVRHLVNHWILGEDGEFVTVRPNGRGPGRSYTIEDTGGCNCEQIIQALELGQGHRKHGCSISAMDDWSAIVDSAQASGAVAEYARRFTAGGASSSEIAGCQSTDATTPWWFGAGLLFWLARAGARRRAHRA
jgi:hypothetical protein